MIVFLAMARNSRNAIMTAEDSAELKPHSGMTERRRRKPMKLYGLENQIPTVKEREEEGQ